VTKVFETACIQGRVPWALIFDQHVGDLGRYRAVCLAGADALTDLQVASIRKFAKGGGGLVLTESTGKFDEKLRERATNPFADLQGAGIVRVKSDLTQAQAVEAMKQACGGALSMSVDAPPHVGIELTSQSDKGRMMAHLVNYDLDDPLVNVAVEVRVTGGVKSVRCLIPEGRKSLNLPFTQVGDRVKVVVPRLEAYALLVLDTK